jgi:Protein of unknown function (DUF664)
VRWIAPDVERSADYPARRNQPEHEMLHDWLDWHRATLLRKCAGLDGARLDDTVVFREKVTSLRWIWQHLVEEYARHNGQADLLREAIDGAAGL